jgi:thioredoxin-related protein
MKASIAKMGWLSLLVSSGALAAENSLPWEKDYPAAREKAQAEKRPIFLMLTATWCGPCKLLERETLPAKEVRAGLKEVVWVKAYEDEKLNNKFNLGGYPTLVFLDSSGERVLSRSSGYEPPAPFLRTVLAARKAADLPLTREMEQRIAKVFTPDHGKIENLAAAGDYEEVANYLAPAREDLLRQNNFLVARLHLPTEIKAAELQATAGFDLPVPDSGVFIIPVPRDGTPIQLNINAPGFGSIQEKVSVDEKIAVATREFTLKKLSSKEAATFSGRVLGADKTGVANAIVRICDWAWTRADSEGRFEIKNVSPGTFLVRAEAPGGEFDEKISFMAGNPLSQDLQLKAVTTVGIRWALQTHEGSKDLVGAGVRAGEAYFSITHSRFLLSRGAEVPQYWGSDFMMRADWQDLRQYIPKDKVAELEKSNNGAPIFWLFDAGSHPNGLHPETARFEDIRAINDGKPCDERSYFQFLRGDTVRKGQVYTVRCVRKDCYAKMEITDVTLVTKDATN